nr:hypothetical protein [Tanacetum cinerariifolium]
MALVFRSIRSHTPLSSTRPNYQPPLPSPSTTPRLSPQPPPPTPPLPHHTTPLPPPPHPVTIIVAYTTTHRRCHSTPTTAATPLPYSTAAAVLLLGVFVWRLCTKLGVFVWVAATAGRGLPYSSKGAAVQLQQ